jgi:hypothetical protein
MDVSDANGTTFKKPLVGILGDVDGWIVHVAPRRQ